MEEKQQNKNNTKNTADVTELAKSFVNPSLYPEMFPEEILDREVVRLGNSGHVTIPSKHIGKRVKVFIYKKEKEGEPNKL